MKYNMLLKSFCWWTPRTFNGTYPTDLQTQALCSNILQFLEGEVGHEMRPYQAPWWSRTHCRRFHRLAPDRCWRTPAASTEAPGPASSWRSSMPAPAAGTTIACLPPKACFRTKLLTKSNQAVIYTRRSTISFNWELRSARALSPESLLSPLIQSEHVSVPPSYLRMTGADVDILEGFRSESTVTKGHPKLQWYFHGFLPHLHPIRTRGFLAGEWNSSDGNEFCYKRLVSLSYPHKDDSLPSRIRQMRHERYSNPWPCTMILPALDTTLETRGYWNTKPYQEYI